jgi:multiple sugar transport system substrate-binding protein
MRITPTQVRVGAGLAAAALAAGVLAGCTADGGGGGDVKSISVTSNFTTGEANGDYFAKIAQEFEDETGIHVDIQEVPNDDIADTFEAASLAGEETDIVILNLTPDSSDWFPNGLTVDVDKYLDDWGIRDKLQQSAIDYWTQNGGVNGFPYQGFNWPVWYNMDLFHQAGIQDIPATFDELVDDAQKLRAAGIQPFDMGGASWPVQNFITWMGQQYLSPDEAQQIFAKGGWCASDAAVKGLDLFAQMRDDGVFQDDAEGYDDTQQNTLYFSGKAAMAPLGSWNYASGDLSDELANATELAGFPTVDGGTYDKPTAFQGHGTGLWVTKKGAEHESAVKQFIQYMYSQPVLAGWVTEANQILSVTPEAIGDAEPDAPLVLKGADITEDTVDFMVLPDGYLPAGLDMSPAGSEFLGNDGETGAQFCQTLDDLYANL